MLFIPALELNPDYLKALMRRAQSSEALEKYEDALEGKKACSLTDNIGRITCIRRGDWVRTVRAPQSIC